MNTLIEKAKKKRECPFCRPQSDIVARNMKAIAFADKYPVVQDHTLIISLRHVVTFFDLDSEERIACLALVDEVREKILKKDNMVTGFNIGINDGMDAGQTIFHSHIHLIPRRKGDVANPRGGIRNIISNGSY